MSPSTSRNLKTLGLILYIVLAIVLYGAGLHAFPQLKADGIDAIDKVILGLLSAPLMVPIVVLLGYAVWIVGIHNPNPDSGHTSYHSGESI